MRPIAELMFVDFFGVAMDQIYNQLAKNTYVTNPPLKRWACRWTPVLTDVSRR